MAETKRIKLVAYGDSLTYGYPDPSVYVPWPEQICRILTRDYPTVDWVMHNAGVPGATTADGLNRLEEMVSVHRPAAVCLAFGSNDANRPFPDAPPAVAPFVYAWNLRQMAELLRRANPGIQLVIMAPPPVDPARAALAGSGRDWNAALADYGEVARAVAAETGCAFADTFPAFSSPSPGEPLWQGDGVHLAPAGYVRLAAAVWPVLRSVLAKIIGSKGP